MFHGDRFSAVFALRRVRMSLHEVRMRCVGVSNPQAGDGRLCFSAFVMG